MKKLNSLKALHAFGLPVLPYKILSKTSIEKEIADFLQMHELSTFMIRTDSDLLYSPSINNATNTSSIHTQIREFLENAYAVFIMHPGNTNKNFHSLNIMLVGDAIHIEVVGPGFIATDLNRSGIVHESMELNLHLMEIVNRRIIVSEELYERQVTKKLIKGASSESYLNKYNTYVPVSDPELLFIKSSVSKLIDVAKNIDSNARNWIASLSFVDYRNKGNEPIFWDLYTLK